MKDLEIVGLQNCYLGFSKFWKFLKISKILNIFFRFQNFSPQKQNFQKSLQYVRGQLTDEYVHKISSRYLQKWLRYDIKHVKNRHFHVISGLPWFSELYFLTDFDASKVFYGHFSRSLRKYDLKTYIAPLNNEFFAWPFFTLWPEMTLTSIMVTKHSKW